MNIYCHRGRRTCTHGIFRFFSRMQKQLLLVIHGSTAIPNCVNNSANQTQGKEGRDRQSQVLRRLKEMEHGSEKRAKLVAREIAELREEGHLERQRRRQLVQVCQSQGCSACVQASRCCSLARRASSERGPIGLLFWVVHSGMQQDLKIITWNHHVGLLFLPRCSRRTCVEYHPSFGVLGRFFLVKPSTEKLKSWNLT